MIPASYPTRLNGATREMVVGKVTAVAGGRWSTWIPIKVNASSTISTGIHGTVDDVEGMPIYQLADLTNLQPWVDYVPVAAVADTANTTNAWAVSATGYIPVIGTYA